MHVIKIYIDHVLSHFDRTNVIQLALILVKSPLPNLLLCLWFSIFGRVAYLCLNKVKIKGTIDDLN